MGRLRGEIASRELGSLSSAQLSKPPPALRSGSRRIRKSEQPSDINRFAEWGEKGGCAIGRRFRSR
jgi:hypothetical protein